MSIRKRGQTWWIDIGAPHGGRIRRSTGTTDKRKAQRQHDELRAELWRNPAPEKVGPTWNDAVIAWLKAQPRDASDRYRIRALGYPDTPLSEVTGPSLASAIADRSPATFNRYLNLINAILNLARRNGWINAIPHIERKGKTVGRVRWLTREEWSRLEAELPTHLKVLARFAVATGFRQHNVTHLQWSQVDLDRRVAWIHPDEAKGGKAIGIPLSDNATEVLRGQIGQHETWVFPYKGKPIGKIKTAWRKAVTRARIDNFTWHDLRHTWASWHIMNGTPIEVLQKLGGWSDIRMVLRYAHLAPEYLAGFANNANGSTKTKSMRSKQRHKITAQMAGNPHE